MRLVVAALLAGCSADVVFIDYPSADDAGTEIIALDDGTRTQVFASDVGAPWLIPIDLSEDLQISALLYEGTLDENGLIAGPLEAIDAPLIRAHLGTFAMQILDGEPNGWRVPASGDPSDALLPFRLPSLPIARLGTGLGAVQTCVTYEDGAARCFGDNSFGALSGDDAQRLTPIESIAFEDVEMISAGIDYTCLLGTDRRVYCFGRNHRAQLAPITPLPVVREIEPVPGLEGIVEITAGREWTCARSDTGVVQCFGLGGDSDPRGETGVLGVVGFPVAVEKIAAGATAVCGIADGRVHCSGDDECAILLANDHQYKEGVEIPFPEEIVRVDLGDTNACGLGVSGSLFCWGCNGVGQTDPTSTDSLFAPKLVLTGVRDFDMGAEMTCALRMNGEVTCWGGNEFGQTGHGNFSDREPADEVIGLEDAVELRAYWNHACARTAIGEVFCWGEGALGQLGDGLATNSARPVEVARIPKRRGSS